MSSEAPPLISVSTGRRTPGLCLARPEAIKNGHHLAIVELMEIDVEISHRARIQMDLKADCFARFALQSFEDVGRRYRDI